MNILLPKTRHPQINRIIDLLQKETTSDFKQVHRMIDLFEVIIKTYSATVIGSYLNAKGVSDNVKGMLVNMIIRPSLGSWQKISRTIVEEKLLKPTLTSVEYAELVDNLKREQIKFAETLYKYCEEKNYYQLVEHKAYNTFYDLKKTGRKLVTILKNSKLDYIEQLVYPGFYEDFFEFDQIVTEKNVVSLRNDYAHGAVPSDAKCREDMKNYLKPLTDILEGNFFQSTFVAVFKGKSQEEMQLIPNLETEQNNIGIRDILQIEKIHENRPYLIHNQGQALDLFPIMYYRSEKDTPKGSRSLLFLNDLKDLERKQMVSQLHYPTAEHVDDDTVYKDFIKIMDIAKWKEEGKRFLNKFEGLKAELTSNFVGREKEIKAIMNFIDQKKDGFYHIYGSPGVGKSALLSKVSMEVIASQNLHTLEYFIRRNSGYNDASSFLNHLTTSLVKMFKLNVTVGSTLEEKYEGLEKILHETSRHLETQQEKLILIIDGLDEAEEGFLSYLPKSIYTNIIFLYASRRNHQVEATFWPLVAKNKTELELGGLSKEAIRALVWQVVSKYEVDHEYYIDSIYEKAQSITGDGSGNAQYVRLLCDEIKQGELKVNQVDKLPKGLVGIYDVNVARFIEFPKALDILYVFAVAKDYITVKQLAEILDNEEVVMKTFLKLKEILVEHNGTYQLFHESFRDYLQDTSSTKSKLTMPEKLVDARNWIIKYCRSWEGYYEKYQSSIQSSIYTYPFKYFTEHLNEAGYIEEVLSLATNESFVSRQIEVTGDYQWSFSLYRTAIQVASFIKEDHLQIELVKKVRKLHQQIKGQTNLFAFSKNIEEWQKALKDATYLNNKEQVFHYTKLLYELLDYDLPDQNKRGYVEKVMVQIESSVEKDLSKVNWCDWIPRHLLLHLFIEMKALEVNINPITERMGLEKVRVFNDKWGWTEFPWDLNGVNWSNSFYRSVISDIISSTTDSSYKDHLLRMLAVGLIDIGMVEDALFFYEQITFHEYRVGVATKIAPCLRDSKGITIKELLDEALLDAQAITNERKKARMMRLVAQALQDTGREIEAKNLARQISLPKERAHFNIHIAKSFIDNKKIPLALKTLKEALRNIEKITVIVEKQGVLELYLHSLSKIAPEKKVLPYLEKISEPYHKVRILCSLAKETFRYGQGRKAATFVDKALQVANKNKEYDVSIVSVLLEQNKIEEAMDFIRNCQKDGERIRFLFEVAIYLQQQGKPYDKEMEQARALIWKAVENQSDVDYVLEQNISFLLESSLLDEAIKIVNQLPCKLKTANLMVKTYSVLCKHGRQKDAAYYFNLAANEIIGLEETERNFAYEELAINLSKHGDYTSCIKYIAKGMQIEQDQLNTRNITRSMQGLMRGFATRNKHFQGLDIIKKTSGYDKSSALYVLVNDLVGKKDWHRTNEIMYEWRNLLGESPLYKTAIEISCPFRQVFQDKFRDLSRQFVETNKMDKGIPWMFELSLIFNDMEIFQGLIAEWDKEKKTANVPVNYLDVMTDPAQLDKKFQETKYKKTIDLSGSQEEVLTSFHFFLGERLTLVGQWKMAYNFGLMMASEFDMWNSHYFYDLLRGIFYGMVVQREEKLLKELWDNCYNSLRYNEKSDARITLGSAYISIGMVEAALEQVEKLDSIYRDELLEKIIIQLCNQDHLDQAIGLLGKLEGRDLKYKLQAYTYLVEKLTTRKQWESIANLIQSVPEKAVARHIITTAVYSIEEQKELEEIWSISKCHLSWSLDLAFCQAVLDNAFKFDTHTLLNLLATVPNSITDSALIEQYLLSCEYLDFITPVEKIYG